MNVNTKMAQEIVKNAFVRRVSEYISTHPCSISTGGRIHNYSWYVTWACVCTPFI